MSEELLRVRHEWVEPAHSIVLKYHDDLVAIHTVIRDRFQARIDEAFDSVSQQTGLVAMMTMPVTLVAAKGRVRALGASPLNRSSLLEKTMAPVLGEIGKAEFPRLDGGEPIGVRTSDPTPEPATVAYDFRLIWAKALRVRFRTEWIEPAHFGPWTEPAHPRPWIEPAHAILDPHPDPWRVPSFEAWKERLLLSVLDEVYPDLRLLKRIDEMVARIRRPFPRPGDPPHFRPLDPAVIAQIVSAVRTSVSPEVREPAHPIDWARRLTPEMVKEIDAVLKKHGL